jgi:hypothetical protein
LEKYVALEGISGNLLLENDHDLDENSSESSL